MSLEDLQQEKQELVEKLCSLSGELETTPFTSSTDDCQLLKRESNGCTTHWDYVMKEAVSIIVLIGQFDT